MTRYRVWIELPGAVDTHRDFDTIEQANAFATGTLREGTTIYHTINKGKERIKVKRIYPPSQIQYVDVFPVEVGG